MKYLNVLHAYLSMGIKVYWWSNLYTNRLIRDLKQKLRLDEITLPNDLIKRIKFYTSQCYIVASWTSTLRGRTLTEEEKSSVIALGAITPILDDLTDISKLKSYEILEALSTKSEKAKDEFLIAKYLYTKLLATKNKDFETRFKKVLLLVIFLS